ncbi:Uncharacterized protein DAT39_005021, partial [Clarias magur]
ALTSLPGLVPVHYSAPTWEQHHLFALEKPRNHIRPITLVTHNSACQLLLALQLTYTQYHT